MKLYRRHRKETPTIVECNTAYSGAGGSIWGGGPYGEIGDSLEDADMDAVSSASVTRYNDQIQGNTQTIAQMIQENVGVYSYARGVIPGRI